MKYFPIKKLAVAFIVTAMCITTAFGAANKKEIEADYNTKGVTINYKIVRFPNNEKPFTVNEIMYVPLKFYSETLGYKVEDYLEDYVNISGGDLERYYTQSGLLKSAMEYVGVDTPEKAVEIWSKGMMQRSGAMQYSVMTNELKEVYAKDLEKGFANWITGGSSPWIESYKILNNEKANETTQTFDIKYETATSTGAFKPFTVTLELNKIGDFWRISKVTGDEMSYMFTGFANK